VLIKQKQASDTKSYEITPEKTYLQRREFLKLGAAGALLGLGSSYSADILAESPKHLKALKFQAADKKGPFWTDEEQTPYSDAKRYNNFYEFGTGKGDPARNAQNFVTDPWSIVVEGEVENGGKFNLEDLYKQEWIEERVYRLRCVEAWSMVIPWLGIPLAKILEQFKPTSKAKYVYFETLYDPKQMPDQRSLFAAIEYPYREGLRIDEAMHPLTLMAVGMYGRELPPQNGAPFRLVVPWKYGFKSIKSIVKIRFQEEMPTTTWVMSNAREYGFYANVNPQVDHPRWTQKIERRLPGSLFGSNRIETRMFNGYEEQVAGLYAGMDLRKFY